MKLQPVPSSAAGAFQLFLEQVHAVAESVGVCHGVSAAEQGHVLPGQIDRFDNVNSVIPVILELSVTPSRGSEDKDIVWLYLSLGYRSHVENIFDIQSGGYGFCHCLCRPRGRTVNNNNLFHLLCILNFTLQMKKIIPGFEIPTYC